MEAKCQCSVLHEVPKIGVWFNLDSVLPRIWGQHFRGSGLVEYRCVFLCGGGPSKNVISCWFPFKPNQTEPPHKKTDPYHTFPLSFFGGQRNGSEPLGRSEKPVCSIAGHLRHGSGEAPEYLHPRLRAGELQGPDNPMLCLTS